MKAKLEIPFSEISDKELKCHIDSLLDEEIERQFYVKKAREALKHEEDLLEQVKSELKTWWEEAQKRSRQRTSNNGRKPLPS